MRFSQYVAEHGIQPFTFPDFLYVGSKVATDPARLILVGGQAIETWGVVFRVPAPTGDSHPLTADTDWLGSQSDAEWLCQLLQAEQGIEVDLQLAKADETGPSTGLAFIKTSDGRVLMMDFLRCIVGPENNEIYRLAVPIRVEGVLLHVLHPLLCLQSRLANINSLASKRQGNGPLQAEWAIDIVTAYIKRVFQDEGERPAIRACHFVESQAWGGPGRYCFLNFGIDPMRAVTHEVVQMIGGRFAADDWPRTAARVRERQAQWTRRSMPQRKVQK